MDFTQLHYFRAVAHHGNLSRAAEELYITQPALSRYITKLEAEVGVPLFDRRRGKVVLNTYGQLFLANVELAFARLEQGTDAVRQLYSKDQNILSISCSVEDFLIDQLKAFSAIHPEIGIHQFSYSAAEVETQVLRHNLDFVICAHKIQNDHIQYDLLSNCPYVLVCHKNNPLAGRRGIQLVDAKEYTFICENTRLTRKQLEQICKKKGFTPHVSHEVENGYILINLLEANKGVCLIPLALYIKIDTYYHEHHLTFLDIIDEDFPLAELGVAYPKDHILSPSAKEFLGFLHENSATEAKILLDIALRRELV